MNLFIFAVYDEKAKAFLAPFFMPTKPMALRVFGDCVNDASHQWGKHPADYNLFCFGSFDSSSGKFDVMSAFELLVNGVMLKEPNGSFASNGSAEVDRRVGRTGAVEVRE